MFNIDNTKVVQSSEVVSDATSSTIKCTACGGNIFENSYGDTQCESCRRVLPFDCLNKE